MVNKHIINPQFQDITITLAARGRDISINGFFDHLYGQITTGHVQKDMKSSMHFDSHIIIENPTHFVLIK